MILRSSFKDVESQTIDIAQILSVQALNIDLYVAPVLEAAGSALSYGLVGIAVAMVFARLKEIKEGVGVADLVEVFR